MSGIKNELTLRAKILDKDQIENILPGYMNIIKQIDKMRNYAKEYKGKSDVMVNNVFSILGKRGAGKSSVLMTLRDNLKNDIDITLPIILPTILPGDMMNKGDMMGWILGNFKEEVEKLSKIEADNSNKREYDEKNFINCKMDEKKTDIYISYINVLKKYRYTREDYADILKENYSGLNEYIDDTRKILDPENDLKKDFFKFIDELVKSKSKEDTKEAMIYIFLDDIDLAKNHCQELLGVISRYLHHPNIVVFLSGDYKIFETEQFLSYMKDSNLKELIVAPKEKNNLGERLLRENEMLAKDALKKIMPPAYRYKLHILDPEERLKFYYVNHKETIKDLLKAKFKRLYEDANEDSHLKVINAYGLILDEMPRGIMNVYYALSNIDNINILNSGSEEEKKNYISQFRILLDTIIRSSSVLSKYEDEINMCIQVNYKDFTKTFFNHERLVKQIKASNEEYCTGDNISSELSDDIIIVLIFTHFVESIVKLVDESRKIHGQKELWELITKKENIIDDKNNKWKLKIYPHLKDTDVIFNLHELMLSNDALNIMPTMDNIYLKDFSVKFYFEQLENIEQMRKEIINVGKITIEDSEWMEEKFKIIYHHRDPLCLMFNKGINIVREQLKLKIDDNYTKVICDFFDHDFYVEITKKEEETVSSGECSIKKETENNDSDDIIKINTSKEKLNEIKSKSEKKILNKIEFYKEKLKEELNSKLAECKKDRFNSINTSDQSAEIDLTKLRKEIEIYFSTLSISTNDEINSDSTDKKADDKKIDFKNLDQDIQIVLIAVLYNTLNEMIKIASYESDYFSYFEEWHQHLKDKTVYKDWCEKRKDTSPLTLVLENE